MEIRIPPYPIQSVDYALQLLLILERDGLTGRWRGGPGVVTRKRSRASLAREPAA
jgi:hypothetical protein